ncbi:MAG: hypothetical protein V8R75_16215 [Oscillospiraceae bacterium]
MKSIQQKLGKTIVFVSHDMGEALKLADTIIFMDGGQWCRWPLPRRCWSIRPTIWSATSWASMPLTPRPSKVEQLHAHQRGLSVSERNRGVLECAERMARGSVDTLLVTDEARPVCGHRLHRRHPPLGPGAQQH